MPLLSPTDVPSKEEMKKALKMAKSPTQVKQHLKMVVYGKPKRGKTHFIGTFPKPLIFDFDADGTGILADRKKFPRFDGKIVTPESWNDIQLWYWILRTQKHPFETVVFDTMTTASQLALTEILGEKGVRTKGEKDPYKAEQDDYGRAGRVLNTWITLFKSLPMHVVFVCHEREDDAPDEAEGEDIVRWLVPDLQRSVRNYLLGQVSIIGYAYRVSRDNQISFRMTFDRPGTVAADRYGLLPRVIKDPTFEKIMSYYSQEQDIEEADNNGDDLD